MSQLAPLEQVLDRFLRDVTVALPDVFAAVAVLILAAVAIKLLGWVLRRFLERTLAEEDVVYRQFVLTIVLGLLWFGVILTVLSMLGLTVVAASLGTSTGFLALGVAYALSGMLEDAVAGVYLLRDPDFNAGDTVTAGGITGDVMAIELRKTRFAVGDSTVVTANAAIEQSWERHAE